jgi:hypothetical protein
MAGMKTIPLRFIDEDFNLLKAKKDLSGKKWEDFFLFLANQVYPDVKLSQPTPTIIPTYIPKTIQVVPTPQPQQAREIPKTSLWSI